MHRWRIFYTAPRAEMKCETRLLEQGIDVFLPKITTLRRWKDRNKKIDEALFSSYIFARVDERDRLRVLQSQGIVRCVSFGGKIAEIREEEVEGLRRTQKDRERLSLWPGALPPVGRRVVVMEGPLRGLKGEVIRHGGHTSVILRISAIRQAVRVSVPADWVKDEAYVRVAIA